MSVNKIFWQDPYKKEITTKVTSVSLGNVITLKDTIAYAFSGGQQSDDGTINGYKILNAEKINKEIYYTIESSCPLAPGCDVKLEIDWEKRYKIMKLHFAAEIILELVYQHFGRPEKIGANITSEKSRIDFIWENNISAIFPVIEALAKSIIDADLEIESSFSDQENEIRYWSIQGFAKVPCGGTHLRRTGEIGALRLKRERQGKNKERIEIYLQ